MEILQLICNYIVSTGPKGTKVTTESKSNITFFVKVNNQLVHKCVLDSVFLQDLETMHDESRKNNILELLSQLNELKFTKYEDAQVLDLTPQGYPKTQYI